MIPHRTFTRCRSVLNHLHRSSTLLPRHQSRLSSTATAAAAATATAPTSSSTSKTPEKNIPTFTGILRHGRDVIPDGYLKTIIKRHLPPEVYAHDVSPEITELVKGGCRTLVLTRDAKRNSLNLDMIRFMNQHLKAYVLSEEFQGVIVRSNSDKVFCDGGDIKGLYDAGIKRNNGQIDAHDLTRTFFREEYRLNYRISKLRQAYVAVMNGSTMGGGAGISVHGRYRVATRNTVFAMPETAIGFFPDVGASYFLPRLDHQLGIFLGLTGHRLTGTDVVHAGLATHWGLPGQDTDIEMLLAGEEIYHRDFPDKAMNMSFPDYGEMIEPPYAELHGIMPNDPMDELLRAAYVLSVIRGIPIPTHIEVPKPILSNGEYVAGRHILSSLMDELLGLKEMGNIMKEANEQQEFIGNTTERAEYKPPHRLKCDHARLLVKAFLEDPNHRYHPAKLWYEMKNVYKSFSLEPHIPAITACFQHDTIEKIIHALKTLPYDQAWAQQQVEILSKMSPTSLKVTLRMLNAGRWMDLGACLKMEYRIAQRMMVNKDFYIGVDAALITRHRKPQWSATLEQVTPAMVDAYFAPFSTNPESPDYEKELDLDDLENPDRVD